jgi:hypothetical protein
MRDSEGSEVQDRWESRDEIILVRAEEIIEATEGS